MKPPKLPLLLDRKIYKTGQTRGADDDQIFQNRVGRNSTVLIPYQVYKAIPAIRALPYENGYIVLVRPSDYFSDVERQEFDALGLVLGQNALVFYELREDWLLKFSPEQHGLTPPTSRRNPLGGHYVARIANTTAVGDARINIGYTTTGLKGAGIRLYEYASNDVMNLCRYQLEAMFWHAVDASEVMLLEGMTAQEIKRRKDFVSERAQLQNLLDYPRLVQSRILNAAHELICPLCLDRVSAAGFVNRLSQAAGRERHDLTVTEINLFHIEELAYGRLNHKPYNLGWGHHHCNVVCKDSGIHPTLVWMKSVVERNGDFI